MGKKVEKEIAEHSESEESENESEQADQQDNEPKQTTQDAVVGKFGLKAINNEEAMTKRLDEVEKNFYNRLESSKLIKKQGRVPFTEHMTISKISYNSAAPPHKFMFSFCFHPTSA
jgi:type VI protein secretion system component Hcp